MKYPAVAAIAAATLLAGCSAPASPPPSAAPTVTSTPTASPSEPTPTATEPAQSERGHTIKKVGEGAKLIDGNGELAVAFTVTLDPTDSIADEKLAAQWSVTLLGTLAVFSGSIVVSK